MSFTQIKYLLYNSLRQRSKLFIKLRPDTIINIDKFRIYGCFMDSNHNIMFACSFSHKGSNLSSTATSILLLNRPKNNGNHGTFCLEYISKSTNEIYHSLNKILVLKEITLS